MGDVLFVNSNLIIPASKEVRILLVTSAHCFLPPPPLQVLTLCSLGRLYSYFLRLELNRWNQQ